MHPLGILLCVSFAASALAQSTYCPPTEVLFVLDESENSLRAASDDWQLTPFNILEDAITSFLSHPLVMNSPNDFRVSAVSYSSGTDQRWVIQWSTDHNAAFSYVNNIGLVAHAGSWTFRGLEMVVYSPTYSNNLMIVISSQGSFDDTNRQQAYVNTDRITGVLGWNPYVIACQGVNAIDTVELTYVNGGNPYVTLNDYAAEPKGYKLLAQQLNTVIEQYLCTATESSSTTTSSGICDDCLYEAGYGFDFDPIYCDSYYVCQPGQEPLRKACPAGTFWDGSTCNFLNAVDCAVGLCIASTPDETMYPSGRCCNSYFVCVNGLLTEETCPDGQVYDSTNMNCYVSYDTTLVCEDTGRYVCDTTTATGSGTFCEGYSVDPFGDPCVIYYNGYAVPVPAGTMWSQTECSLVFAENSVCTSTSSVNVFFGDAPASLCNAVFLATYDYSNTYAYSERMGENLDVQVILNEAYLSENGIYFDMNMANPYGYYFFFNNRPVAEGTAFRIRFRLDDTSGEVKTYDILSNNYCDLCEETVSITVTPNGYSRLIRATFTLTDGNIASIEGNIYVQSASNTLEVIVIIGTGSIYGQVSELPGNNPATALQTVAMTTVVKESGVEVMPNRCGYMLGQGPNDNFYGLIDDFAMFEYCENINQVLR